MRSTQALLAVFAVSFPLACGRPADPAAADKVAAGPPTSADPAITVTDSAAPADGMRAGARTPGTDPADPGERAKGLLTDLLGGKIPEVYAQFDASMTALITEDQLRTNAAAIAQAGALNAVDVREVVVADGVTKVTLDARFELVHLEFLIAWNADGKVVAFLGRPPQPAYPAWEPPSDAQQEAFTEEEVAFGEPGMMLPGTLTLPKDADKPLAAVVLVHGSGPQDQDASLGSSKMFKDIAWALGSQGIAVLRYSKVTQAHPAAWVAKHGDTITLANETTDDALAAVAFLRNDKRIDAKRIVFAGHSQGAIAAPRACTADPALAGIVMLAGPARPLEDVIVAQLETIASLDGPSAEATKTMLPAMKEAAARVKDPNLSVETAKGDLPLGIPAAFWLDLRANPPETVAAACRKPVLVLQGEADYQSTVEDLALWQRHFAGHPNATFKRYPQVGHTFIDLGVAQARPESYVTTQGHVAEAVIADLVAFVRSL